MGKGSGTQVVFKGYVKGGHADVRTYTRPRLLETEDHYTKNHVSKQERHIGPKGLLNVGNTCYANAALQCLLSTALTHALMDPGASAIFRRYSSNPGILEQGSGSVDSNEDLSCSSNTPRRRKREKTLDECMQEKCEWLSRELNRITLEYHAPEPHANSYGGWMGFQTAAVIDPGIITRRPDRLSSCLKPYQQEDAHEFLRALLGTLVMHGQNKELSSLFDGLLESSVTCQNCRRPSLTRDRYMDLSLDINRSYIQTLEDALKEFTKTEILTGDNKVFCSRCETKHTSAKELRLATAPSILVAHFKRFAFDEYGRMIRLHKKIKFPLTLEIGDYMSRFNKARPPPYELVAVLVHQGVTCDSGHYLAYVKQCGNWYRCNDSIIELVDVGTVLDQQAYILMYEVAEMRENNGFPSPNTSVREKSASPRRPGKTDAFSFTNMLCGMDYDATMFADVCSYASKFSRKMSDPVPQSPSSVRRSRRSKDTSRDSSSLQSSDGNIAAATKRRAMRRSSSSGNLTRLNAYPEDERLQTRSVSAHSRHRRKSSFSATSDPGLKVNTSREENRKMLRLPQKGDLPPRPSGTPICRRYLSDGNLQ